MDIRSEAEFLVVYTRNQQDAEALGNRRAVEYYGKFVRQSLDAIDRWADMANAALALAEHQATSGYDPSVDSKAYTAERGRLWDAFVAARAKAKAIREAEPAAIFGTVSFFKGASSVVQD